MCVCVCIYIYIYISYIIYALDLKKILKKRKKKQPPTSPRMCDNLISKQFDLSKLTVTFLELLRNKFQLIIILALDKLKVNRKNIHCYIHF